MTDLLKNILCYSTLGVVGTAYALTMYNTHMQREKSLNECIHTPASKMYEISRENTRKTVPEDKEIDKHVVKWYMDRFERAAEVGETSINIANFNTNFYGDMGIKLSDNHIKHFEKLGYKVDKVSNEGSKRYEEWRISWDQPSKL